jgi:hypothetical protein
MEKLAPSLALCLSLAVSLAGPAQQKPGKSSPASPPADAERQSAEPELSALQQRGLGLLRQAGEEAASLDDRRSAARIQAVVADTLWEHDAEMARALFQKAFDAALAYYRESKDDNTDRVTRGTSVGRQDVRLEVLRLANRHDAAFGRALTDQYIEEKQREQQEARQRNVGRSRPNDGVFGPADPAAGDLLQVASSLLEVDVKSSVEMAERAFSAGITQGAPSFLARLGGRDRAAADQLYLSLLTRLRASPAPLASHLLLLSAYPFGEEQVWVTNGQNSYSFGFTVPPDFKLEPQLVQQLFATALTVLARNAELNPAEIPDAPSRFGAAAFAARVLEPKVTQFQPTLLEEWRASASRLTAATAVEARAGIDQTLQEVARQRQPGPTPDASDRIKSLLDQADRTNDFARKDNLYPAILNLEIESIGVTLPHG